MKVVVTGAAGFLGNRVADALLASDSPVPVSALVLTDAAAPMDRADPRVSTRALDLTAPNAAHDLLAMKPDLLLHLAAVVSGHAESDFDFGLSVNFDATRALLEEARRSHPQLRLVFTSTVGVFGGELPSVVSEFTAATPQSSYGTAKAMCELLVNEYSRRNWVDGRVVRLPTVSVRSGAANRAVTSFASGVVREPLSGKEAVVPVPAEQGLWLTSPGVVVRNILHAAALPADVLGPWRVINLPGFRATVQGMVNALRAVAGDRVANLVKFDPDKNIARIVASFPDRFDNTRALALGFSVDYDFKDVIKSYISEISNAK